MNPPTLLADVRIGERRRIQCKRHSSLSDDNCERRIRAVMTANIKRTALWPCMVTVAKPCTGTQLINLHSRGKLTAVSRKKVSVTAPAEQRLSFRLPLAIAEI